MKKDAPKPAARKSVTAKSGARRPATRKKAAAIEPPEASATRPKKNLLTAGIKALSEAHGEVVARQSRVFESILGLKRDDHDETAAKPSPLAAAALDPFGFRKFEDVFDQRVARTLQRLDVPEGQAIAALKAEIDELRAEVARLKARVDQR